MTQPALFQSLKLTQSSYHEQLRMLENVADEVMSGARMPGELASRIHSRVDLPAHFLLHQGGMIHNFSKRGIPDDHHVNVACRAYACLLCKGAVDERDVDPISDWCKSLSKVFSHTCRLGDKSSQIFVDRGLGIRSIHDCPSDEITADYSGVGQPAKFPLHGAVSCAYAASDLTQEGLLGFGK